MKDKYIKLSAPNYRNISFFIMIFCIFIQMIFILLIGNLKEVFPYLVIFGIVFLFDLFLFVYFNNEAIYFNDNNIIVKNFLSTKKKYNYDDIIKVINKIEFELIIYTKNGKFKVGYYVDNFNSFLDILKNKNINIESKKMFERFRK